MDIKFKGVILSEETLESDSILQGKKLKNLTIHVVGQSEQLRACKLIDKCSNPGTLCREGKHYACYK